MLPSPEVCATFEDDDCDGPVNEEGIDCVCTPGSIEPCYEGPSGTEGVGPCAGGEHVCDPTGLSFGPCAGQVLPVPEDCSTAADDNCNGQVNEPTCGICAGCTSSQIASCPSGVAVIGHYQGGSRSVCIPPGDGSTFKLALMSYETTHWALSGAVSRVQQIQVYTYDAPGSITGNAGIPTSVQQGGSVPADPYTYAMSMGDCPAHTGYAGAVFGVPQASVCHLEAGLPGACSSPGYQCLSIFP